MIKEICPECEKRQLCQEIKEYTVNIKGKDITIPVNMRKCTVCGEVFVPLGSDGDIFDKAYRLYRKKHDMMQPEEIKELRKKYKLSQQGLADMLGIEVKYIQRYEKGSLQKKSHDELLKKFKKTTKRRKKC
jgi:putative zinc finger/helix-turn-helix YgiT family protein